MQSSWLAGIGAALALVFAVGCEDGPTQTFKPAPGGADWNDGKGGGSTDPSKQGFGEDIGGRNKMEICTAPQKKAAWAKAFVQPIIPPRRGGGIDMAGDDTWKGLTVEEAESINCQSENAGDWFGNGNSVNYWGDNGEIIIEYIVATRKIDYMAFEPGYTGTIAFKSRDGLHSYVLALSKQITKDGSPYTITWDENVNTGKGVWANELTDGIFATFSPGLPPETNCRVSGHCVIGNFGDQGYLYLPPTGTAFRVANINGSQPTPSTPYYFDQYLAKVLPFALADPVLKLDAEGPIAVQLGLGPNNKTCKLQMGLKYGDFLSNCIQVSGQAMADTAETNKLLGGLQHSNERYRFSMSGVDINFTADTLPKDDVIRDKDRPQANDMSSSFSADQGTLGVFANDFTGNDPKAAKDLHWTGLVYGEFVRAVQEKINASLPVNRRHNLGAPECLTGDLDKIPPADGCTGFEGFVVPLDPAKIADPYLKKLGVANPVTNPLTKPLLRGLKPGHQAVIFCDGQNQTNCFTVGDTFPTSYARVLKTLGKGKVSALPIEMRDSRFMWQQWAIAFFKYLLVDQTGTATATDVQNAPFNPYGVFFDSLGAGQFEEAEYIDRRFVTNSIVPTDIVAVADILNGIFADYVFSRDLLRGEEALLTSTREVPTDPIGKEDNAFLTNIFGNQCLLNGWKDHPNATAYQCATGTKNLTDCEGQGPPRDEQGNVELDLLNRPLLTPYPGAFTSSGTIFRLGSYTPISVKTIYPNILSAMVVFPQHSNPYDTASAPAGPATIELLQNWTKKQPGIGFEIPLNGQTNKFIQTYEINMSGLQLTANIDYDLVDPKNEAKGLKFLAVETNDFMGDVFLCRDPKTGDLLHTRMYETSGKILDWMGRHPNAEQDCGIIVRWSPYGNYPDFITSLNCGVQVVMAQGGGLGRIVDVNLFLPGL